MENTPRFTPQYLHDYIQLADRNRLSWAFFLLTVTRRFWTCTCRTPGRCVAAWHRTETVSVKGRKQLYRLGRKQAIWAKSLNSFPWMLSQSLTSHYLIITRKSKEKFIQESVNTLFRFLESVFTDSWINANLQHGSYLHTSHFYWCILELSTVTTSSESTLKSHNSWDCLFQQTNQDRPAQMFLDIGFYISAY